MNSPETGNSTSPSLPKSSSQTSKAPRRSSTSTSSRREASESSSKPAAPRDRDRERDRDRKTSKSTTNEPTNLPPVTNTLRQPSGHSDRRSSRESSSSGHTKAVRRNSTTPKSIANEPSSDVFSGTDSMLSTGHTKAARRMSSSSSTRLLSSNLRDTKSIRPDSQSPNNSGDTIATESPTTSPMTPPKQYPLSAGSAAKFAREVKVLTETVQALANKLKRRDKEVQKLQETAQKYAEVSQKLESTEERLVEAKMENKSMSIVVQGLKSSLELQGTQNNEEKSSVASANGEKKMVDPEEHRKVRSERDSAMTKAGAMAMTLAECRAETDDLKDQLAAVKEQLEQQNNIDAPHSPSANYPPTTGAGSVCPPTARSGMAKGLSLRNLMAPMTPGGNLNKKMGNLWGTRSTHGGAGGAK